MSTISGISSSVNYTPAQNSGLAAIAAASQQLNQAAQQVANPANANFIAPMVAATQSLSLTQAGAAVISTSNEMMGSLLDVFA
jgi:flagellar basal body rod protein FlgG